MVKAASTNGSRPKTIKLDKIRLDGDTQSRKELDEDVVKEYSDLMKDGVEFPPLGVVFDGSDYFLWDGFHRRHAAVKANLKEIKCIVTNGTREDARWLSYGANISHGLKRTIEDKQKAVDAALKHPKGMKMSDRQIAEHVGVSPPMVAKRRDKLSTTVKDLQSTERTGADGRTINTANIGKKSSEPKEHNPRIECPDGRGFHEWEGGKCIKCGYEKDFAKKPQASATGSEPTPKPATPDLPSGGTVNRTDTGSQDSGDAGECPTDYGKCPNCAGTKWTEDEESGVACAKCHHPHGEPTGGADDERVTIQRSKTVKTAEALMRAFDDLNLLASRPREHASAIATCKILLKTARDWK